LQQETSREHERRQPRAAGRNHAALSARTAIKANWRRSAMECCREQVTTPHSNERLAELIATNALQSTRRFVRPPL
jgi:hypothetical protein